MRFLKKMRQLIPDKEAMAHGLSGYEKIIDQRFSNCLSCISPDRYSPSAISNVAEKLKWEYKTIACPVV
jgi:hypothetical protein